MKNCRELDKQAIFILRHGGLELVSGLENTLRSAERGVSRVGLVRPLCRFRRRLALNARLSSRPIAFGAGFVLTVDKDSTAVVNVAPSSGRRRRPEDLRERAQRIPLPRRVIPSGGCRQCDLTFLHGCMNHEASFI